MKRALICAALLSLALTACGTTVPMTSTTGAGDGLTATGPGGTGTAAGTTGSSLDGGSSGTTSGGGTAAPGLVSGGTGAALGGTGTTGSTGGQGAVPPPAGTKLLPIEVGILLYPDINEFAAMFGGEVNTGDQDLIVDTAVKWVNANGGAGGHPIRIIKHYVSLTSADTYDQLAQQACEDFTVDHKAVAVFAPGTSVSNNFAACLKKAGALLIMSGHWMHDSTDWKQHPNLYSPAEADMGSVGRAMVDQILGRKLATRGEKVGLMVMEEPGGVRASDNVIKPLLKAQGIEVVEYRVPPPASTADIGNSVAVNNSAELRMASQGIKTIMFLCPGCLKFFAQQADSQQYYPRYIVSSLDTLGAQRDAALDRAYKTAIGIGWEPNLDVGLYSRPKELTDNPTRALCKKIMGPIKQSTDDASEFVTQAVCDGFLQIKRAGDANPANPLTGPAMQKGMGLLGSRFPSALSFSTRLAPDHHGGATSYRTLRWDSPSTSFVYDSPKRLSFR
jgi:hypothetical protein